MEIELWQLLGSNVVVAFAAAWIGHRLDLGKQTRLQDREWRRREMDQKESFERSIQTTDSEKRILEFCIMSESSSFQVNGTNLSVRKVARNDVPATLSFEDQSLCLADITSLESKGYISILPMTGYTKCFRLNELAIQRFGKAKLPLPNP